MPRVMEVQEVPGVEEALASGNPLACATRIAEILSGGADRREVARTAALAAARHFHPSLPPPHGLPTLGAALEIAPQLDPPALPLIQACGLAASEWRRGALARAKYAVSGDELHLARSFLEAVRTSQAEEADAIFSGLLREGDERRLAGDALFEACVQDSAGGGHKRMFAVGSWRLARALGWIRGPVILAPAVHLAVGPSRELSDHSMMLREVGRARLDVELAARNSLGIDQTARNAYAIALQAGPERLVAELIAGLKRGRTLAGYADLVAATAAERTIANPESLEPFLLSLATRFLIGFSRTSYRVLALLTAGRVVAAAPGGEVPRASTIADPVAALNELELAVEGDDSHEAASLALGLAEAFEPQEVARVLLRQATLQDAHGDGGHGLVLAAWAIDLAAVAPGPALAALAAHLARTPKSRTIADGL